MTAKVVQGFGRDWKRGATRRSDVPQQPRRRWGASLAAVLIGVSATAAVGQGSGAPEELIGTWSLVAVDNVGTDGTRIRLYGSNPHGLLVLDRDGHYSLQIMSDGRPKFAANDKAKGTPEEYKAATQGSNCHFGRYTVDDAGHTITLHVEQATFTNWEGLDLTWPFTLNGDESKFVVPHPTTGGPGVIGEIVWRRAR